MRKVAHYYTMGGIKYYQSNQATDCFQARVTLENSAAVVTLFERPQSYHAYHSKVFYHNANKPLESIRKAHRYAYLWVLLNSKEQPK